MSYCQNCEKGEYHGLLPKGTPDWMVSTVYFWCPVMEHHNPHGDICVDFKPGQPRRFDKRGNELFD